jgi:hypothetical protein
MTRRIVADAALTDVQALGICSSIELSPSRDYTPSVYVARLTADPGQPHE